MSKKSGKKPLGMTSNLTGDVTFGSKKSRKQRKAKGKATGDVTFGTRKRFKVTV